MDNLHFTLSSDAMENFEIFGKILNKDPNTMINEALEQYFDEQQKKLLEKNMEKENALTSLEYDEFWDGVDI